MLLRFSPFFFLILSVISFSFYSSESKSHLRRLIKQNEEALLENPNDLQVLKTLGICYHNLSRLGEKSAADKAIKYLEEASKLARQADAEVLAYLGSSYTLKGRDEILPINKIKYVRKGCKLIDKAVGEQPRNVVVRMVRLNNSLALPRFFGRRKYAKEDCLFLISCHERKELEIGSETLAEIYLRLGEFYRMEGNLNEAKRCWRKAIEHAPESQFAIEAKEKIERFGK